MVATYWIVAWPPSPTSTTLLPSTSSCRGTTRSRKRRRLPGGILALAAVLPEACVRVFELAHQGGDEATGLQERLVPLAQLLGATYGVPGFKAALILTGFDVGYPRPPLAPLGETQIATLREALHLFQETVV